MRTILVTGATGAIGSELTRRFLSEDDTRVRLLIRATSREHLEQRLDALFRFWGLDRRDDSLAARVEALAGDVTQPQLGLESGTRDRLTREVTHLVHSAGNVKLNRPLAEARRSAVDSARHIVSFVNDCLTRAPFQKLEFVSTVGVGGLMPGALPERPIVEQRTFRNSYEAAKAEAEAFLFEEMDKGLPATIHRPSMVVGDSGTGRIIQFQVFYHLCEFLSGRRTAGIVPDVRGFRLDIIPVDYVARAIQISTACAETAGRVFHLCAGPDDAPLIDDVGRRVRASLAAQGRPVPQLRVVSPRLIRALLPAAKWCVGAAKRRAFNAIPFFLAYLETPRGFANATSRRFFAAAGLEVPQADRYLDCIVGYYLKHS